MSGTYRALIPLLSSYGILLVANGLFNTIVALRSKGEAFADSAIGVVMSGYFAGLLLSSFYAVVVVARIGHIRAFATFASVASTVALAHLLWVSPTLWFFLRIISGFCMGGMIVVTEGWLNERANNKNRGTILSLYMITTYACVGVAQLVMLFGNPNGFKLFVVVSILYSFALIPILTSQTQAPAAGERTLPNIKRLYQTSPVGMIGAFIVGILNGTYYSLAPIYALGVGLTIQETAIFMALSASSGMLLQLPLGKISDKIDRRWVLVFSASMTAIACMLLFNATAENKTFLYACAVFYGSVAFSINPICTAHVNDLAPANERTQTASALLMFYGVGAVIGPFIAGVIMHFGSRYIFMLSASIALCFAVYTLLRLWIKPRHLQHKTDFEPYAVQSPARRLWFKKDN